MKVAASEMRMSHCGEAPPSPLVVFQPPGWSNDFLKLPAAKASNCAAFLYQIYQLRLALFLLFLPQPLQLVLQPSQPARKLRTSRKCFDLSQI